MGQSLSWIDAKELARQLARAGAVAKSPQRATAQLELAGPR